MPFTKEGIKVEVIDTLTADQIEERDLILIGQDPIEVTSVIDSGDSIMVKGESHLSGDNVTYMLTPDATVELWVP